MLVVLSVFLGVVFLVFLLTSVRLLFSSSIFFSLFLNFRLLGRVGLGSRLFCCVVRLSLLRLVMRASVGLRIEGRPTEESVSGRNGGGLGGPVVVVNRNQQNLYPKAPTAVAKLPQYSGSRVEHRDEFSSCK